MVSFTVGRGVGNQIVLSDTSVSRQHGVLTITDDGEIVFEDKHSSNGSYEVRDGELVRFAKQRLSADAELVLGELSIAVAELLRLAELAEANGRVENVPSGLRSTKVKVISGGLKPEGKGRRIVRDRRTGRVVRRD